MILAEVDFEMIAGFIITICVCVLVVSMLNNISKVANKKEVKEYSANKEELSADPQWQNHLLSKEIKMMKQELQKLQKDKDRLVFLITTISRKLTESPFADKCQGLIKHIDNVLEQIENTQNDEKVNL